MLAVSIAVPRSGTTINVAIADHVPIAELIPHLVEKEAEVQPGQHWVLSRSTESLRPEHTLSEAGVRPGELLTLDLAHVPAPESEAIEELSGPVGTNPAAWVVAALATVFAWRATPLFHPLEYHGLAYLGVGGEATALQPSADQPVTLMTLSLTVAATLIAAALSLRDRRYAPLAAALGFGLGLNINVLTACVCAALAVWRNGAARIITVVCAIFAALNFIPGVTLILAVICLSFAGQVAAGIAGIKLPKVPATGVFQEPTRTRAGQVVAVHSSVIFALCLVIAATTVQLIPWGTQATAMQTALGLAVASLGVSARGARPVHALCLACLSATVCLWLAWHSPLGPFVLLLTLIPLMHVKSPTVGRAVDALEAIGFAAIIPLALHTTGLFQLIRGLG